MVSVSVGQYQKPLTSEHKTAQNVLPKTVYTVVSGLITLPRYIVDINTHTLETRLAVKIMPLEHIIIRVSIILPRIRCPAIPVKEPRKYHYLAYIYHCTSHLLRKLDVTPLSACYHPRPLRTDGSGACPNR